MKGKGEGGVQLRVDGKVVQGSESGGHWRYQWGKGSGNSGYSVQRGRVYVWLREGRRLSDARWHAHHQSRREDGLHVRQGGFVRGKPAREHMREHGQEGGQATATKRRAKVAAVGRKVAAMNAARKKIAKKKKNTTRPHGGGQGRAGSKGLVLGGRPRSPSHMRVPRQTADNDPPFACV